MATGKQGAARYCPAGTLMIGRGKGADAVRAWSGSGLLPCRSCEISLPALTGRQPSNFAGKPLLGMGVSLGSLLQGRPARGGLDGRFAPAQNRLTVHFTPKAQGRGVFMSACTSSFVTGY